jgi:hypothetical protein
MGFRAELNTGPTPEDPTLSLSRSQRFTYFYDIVFDPTNDAFAAVTPTTPQTVRLVYVFLFFDFRFF